MIHARRPGWSSSMAFIALPLWVAGCGTSAATSSPRFGTTGRIVAVAAVDDADRPHNVALAVRPFDADAGEPDFTALWEADSEISDWLPSPDGRRTMYREVWHYVPKTEALVVRDLTAGAAPRYAVMGEPELSRLSGQVWSPDGTSIAYGVQAGDVVAFSGAGGTRRWEMRAVTLTGAPSPTASAAPTSTLSVAPNADRRLFALDGPSLGTDVYTLLAWSPGASRAALLEAPGGGGTGSSAVRIYDTTDGRLVRRVAPGGEDPWVAASPDGRWVAWLDAAVGVGLIAVADGAWQRLSDVNADPAVAGTPFALAWSHDAKRLGWAVAWPEDGQSADFGRSVTAFSKGVRGRPWTVGIRRASMRVESADGGLGMLALSPDGSAALVTGVNSLGRAVARVAPLRRGGGRTRIEPTTANGRMLDGRPWAVGWWP